MKNKKLICIVGATAVGKTNIGIQLAKYFETVVISADSRQFYKELNIGTAKPTSVEMNGITHYFIDNQSITENYSVGEYEKDALILLEKLFETHDKVILVGGSGLYVRALCDGLDEFPEISSDIRVTIQNDLEEKGLTYLTEKLKILDVEYYQEVDLQNTQRVLRALEVCIGTEKPYSSFRKKTKKERPFEIIKIGLHLPREILYQKIDARMDLMLEQGLKQEATNLLPFASHNALKTVGYQEIFDFLDNKYDWNECVRLLKRNSRRYAKRQITWFGADHEISWFEPTQLQKIIDFIS
ncbi:MAG: tRNA (adenosine(37)-N6)-dimethylallyltransferase MiaA [Bacteroidetes bacterium]|nr:MAG: tRNA (adenosine(37)-N6)-dimethylallyltransferase MiaA [Bacteroidota bacterium]TAG86900.1 MAG: tRNA (adenosine(37)-N6)-dimethylallyltransferase MiaA [Bacteroidota bacterium]